MEERGLKNIPTTADALPAFKDDYIIKLFETTGVLSGVELASRFEVYAEQYLLSIEVEAKLVVDMATTLIYPAAISYLAEIAHTAVSLKEMGIDVDISVAKSVTACTNGMMAAVSILAEATAKHDFDTVEAHMNFCAGTICDLMLDVRAFADELEGLVADSLWPLPKYQEMLFIR
ncbi:MAG: glutamine synthetase [Candidatus Azotimanducaceae bacterium]